MECVACEYVCKDSTDQAEHYKSDWHRYNLRRRVRDMPSICFPAFERRLVAAQNLLAAKQAEDAADLNTYTCVICRKNFSSKAACNQHIQSKKHKAKAKKSKIKPENQVIIRYQNKKNTASAFPDTNSAPVLTNSDVSNKYNETAGSGETGSKLQKQGVVVGGGGEEEEEEKEELLSGEEEEGDELDELSLTGRKAIPINSCLFCSHTSANMQENLEHMRTEHSFFLPEEKFICDLEGYLTYLGQKVGLGFLCLYCAGDKHGFKSLQAVQSHMRDKQHCRVCYNDDFDRVEYESFYDYSSKFKDGVRVPLGEKLAIDATGEAVLFDGTRIGHRLFKQFYKQRIIPQQERDAFKLNRKSIADRFWSHALGVPNQKAPKGFHHTAKSIILFKQSKQIALKSRAVFVRQQKNHQKGIDGFFNKRTGQVRGGMHASYTMAR